VRHHLQVSQTVPGAPREVFDFFSRAENLERLTPPELGFHIVTPRPIEMKAGVLIDYRLRLFGLRFGWRSLISRWEPPAEFVDVQVKGPYKEWIHRHRFEPVAGGTRIHDEVQYALPLSPLGDLAYPAVKAQLKRIFGYRHRVIGTLFGTLDEER